MHKLVISAVVIILIIASLGVLSLANSAPTIHYGFNYNYIYQKMDEQWYTVNIVDGNKTQGTLVRVECNNTGSTAGTFIVIVKFDNATISPQTSQPYTLVNSSAARFSVTVSASAHRAFDVYFDIDSDTLDFWVNVAFESSQLFIHSEQSNRWGYLGLGYATNASRTFFWQLV